MINKLIYCNLGHVYNVTDYFNYLTQTNQIVGTNDCYKYGYFIAHDVWDTHIYRIQIGLNSNYESEPDTKIIETYNIPHEELLEFCKAEYNISINKNIDIRKAISALINKIGLHKLLKIIIHFDYDNGFDNWDVDEFRFNTPLSELISTIDGGYGITKIDLDGDLYE